MLLGLVGPKQSGKSTIAQYLVEKCGYTDYAMAHPIKEIAKVFGFTEAEVNGTDAQKMTPNPQLGICAREFLQKFGTEFGRETLPEMFPRMTLGESQSVWIHLAECFLERQRQRQKSCNVVISDIRFPDEAAFVQRRGGLLVYVNRPLRKDAFSAHASEQLVSTIHRDYTVENDGSLEYLYKQVEAILSAEQSKYVFHSGSGSTC